MKRAIYIGQTVHFDNGLLDFQYRYGMTGCYSDTGTFFPDDNGCKAVAVDKKDVYVSDN